MSVQVVRDWVERHTALEPALLAGGGFDHFVRGRMRALELDDPAGYVEHLERSPDEVRRVMTSVAVPESSLFRYPDSYALLVEHLAARRAGAETTSGRLRMLSAGCAYGQEPCSMGMAALHAGWPPDRVRIDAVDLDPARIEIARRGRYRAARPQIPLWARRWVREDADEVEVSPEVLSMIAWAQTDILAPDASATPPYAVIFCRNVLIYLHDEARNALARRLAAWLAPDGLLFVGHADRGRVLDGLFVPLAVARAFALRHAPAAPPPAAGVAASRRRAKSAPPSAPISRSPGPLLPAPTLPPAPPAGPPAPRATPVDPAPDGSSPAFETARALADRGQLAEALAAAEALLAAEGPKVDTLELLGHIQLALGALRDARDCFRKAIYLEPDREGALLQLAAISDRLHEPEQAARYRRRAARAHRDDADGGWSEP